MIVSKIKSIFAPRKEAVDVATPWLLALRWGEILCQVLLTLAVVVLMDIQVPVTLVAFILVFEAGSNLYLHFLQNCNHPISHYIIVIILLLDTVLLTLLLYATGGTMNPFVFLYLIHIVLGAIILPESSSWLITVTTLVCYGLLFYFPPPIATDLAGAAQPGGHAGHHMAGEDTSSFQLHLQGMWVAFVITASFIVFFVSKIQKALAEHRTTLLTLEKEKTRNDKLASLASLAAGAAHELSTPLSTVAVVSKEMIYALEEQGSSADLLNDAHLIRKQIADCKEILYQMAASTGEHLGEEIKRYSIREITEQILQEMNEKQRRRIRVDPEMDIGTVNIPFRSLCRTVKGLLLNGLEASSDNADVDLHWFTSSDRLYIKISDSGTGIKEGDKELVTAPFFTTKKSGLGLGLFLAKNLADQFRGTLDISSETGKGTIVMMSLPLDLLAYKPFLVPYS